MTFDETVDVLDDMTVTTLETWRLGDVGDVETVPTVKVLVRSFDCCR